jgi:MutS-like protein
VNPRVEYQNRLTERRAVSEREQKLYLWLGNVRLGTAIAGLILAFFVFGETVISPWWLAVPVTLFAALVVVHARVAERLERATRAVAFYERGLARIEHRWMGQGEPGERFRDPAQVYEEDLDVFGKGSLFELLCTARTRAGEDALARWLLAPAAADEVSARQQAIGELRARLDLREGLAVDGDVIRSNMDADAAARWGEAPPVTFPAGARFIAAILAATVVLTFGLYMGRISTRTPLLIALFVDLGYGFFLGSRTLQVAGAVNSPARDLELFAKLLEWLEREPFEAPLLRRMQAALSSKGLQPEGTGPTLRASLEIGLLRRLVAQLDWQRNILFAPIAMALLWSPQIAIAIERWRRRAGPHIGPWIAGVGEFEAMLALAGYSYEHPLDPLPEITDVPGGWFEAAGLGHPLMPDEQCVRNNIQLGGELRLLIVSGSNMSGKSTLLRAVGLNVVLAWAGAPVRAASLRISPLQVGASIRVLDSLQDGRSRFYAEITRLREIVKLASGSRPVLFLMDELLSGTNSHDRKIGAGAIVRMLVERGAIGLITTHDLALANIAQDLAGRAANVHFADTLEDGKLNFDYRLRAGVVERSNALDLMRSVGLDV